MSNLANHVKKNFDGMLIFGDIHGEFDSFMRVYACAMDQNLYMMSLGDLVDRGRNPYKVVEVMHSLIVNDNGGMIIGNHDDKHYRGLLGNKVRFSKDAKQTLDDVGPERMAEFGRMYKEIIEDSFHVGLFQKFDDFTLVHAASHPAIWENPNEIGKSARSRFLVGETNGEVYDDGYPVRLYNWIGEVPMGKTVIVGHDKQPIHNIPITEPLTVNNPNGGKAIFMDTGCGKGGFLTGAVMIYDNGFKLDRFVEFK